MLTSDYPSVPKNDMVLHRITIDGRHYALVRIQRDMYRVGCDVQQDGTMRLGIRSFASVKEAYDQLYCDAIQS